MTTDELDMLRRIRDRINHALAGLSDDNGGAPQGSSNYTVRCAKLGVQAAGLEISKVFLDILNESEDDRDRARRAAAQRAASDLPMPSALDMVDHRATDGAVAADRLDMVDLARSALGMPAAAVVLGQGTSRTEWPR